MKLSVIMPVYNSEKMIENTILSFNKSNFKEKELIIIDDGSIDNSVFIIKKIIKSQKNIVLIESKHNGPGYSRNIGIEIATGKYITFFDSDDLVPPNAYSLLYDYATNYNADMVVGQILRKINGSKWYIYPPLKNFYKKYGENNIAGKYDIILTNPSPCNKIFKKSIIDKYNIRFPNEYMMEDLLFLVNFFLKSTRFFLINEVVYIYESNIYKKKSTTLDNSDRIILSGFNILQNLIKIFPPSTNIYENTLILENNFQFLMDRFFKSPSEIIFNTIQKYLNNFREIPAYETIIKKIYGIAIQDILDIKMNIFILLHSKFKK